MTTNDVLFEKINHIGIITLNKPTQLNALNHHMILALHSQLLEWKNDDSIHAVVIKAAKGRAFSAGGDLKITHYAMQNALPDLDYFFKHEYALNTLIHHFPKPYIALINGIVMGGGAGISIHGSHRIGTENVLFAMPETGIGFFPDVGGTYFLSRLPDYVGMYLGLTGDRISLEDCMHLGLITHFVPETELENCFETIVETSAQQLNEHLTAIQKPLLKKSNIAAHQAEIKMHFGKEKLEDIFSSLEKNKSSIAEHALTLLSKNSPTSLSITFNAIKKASFLTFEECMNMETALAIHFTRSHDFKEGIRAAVIDKDRSPKWNPAQLKDITTEWVESYFKNPEEIQR